MTKMSRNRYGFTLIEVVMIIVVASIAGGALLMGAASIVQNSVMPHVEQIATGLAERELERVAALRFSDIVDEALTSFASPYDDYAYQVDVDYLLANFTVTGFATHYKRIIVTVTHSLAGSVTLTTVVSNRSRGLIAVPVDPVPIA